MPDMCCDAAFPQLEKLTAETLWPAFNAIRKPSLIRVEADEAQYPMHIILRSAPGNLCSASKPFEEAWMLSDMYLVMYL